MTLEPLGLETGVDRYLPPAASFLPVDGVRIVLVCDWTLTLLGKGFRGGRKGLFGSIFFTAFPSVLWFVAVSLVFLDGWRIGFLEGGILRLRRERV